MAEHPERDEPTSRPTSEADDATLAELRNFAREIAAGHEPPVAGRTVDVDEATLAELRRFAAQVATGGESAPTAVSPPPAQPSDRVNGDALLANPPRQAAVPTVPIRIDDIPVIDLPAHARRRDSATALSSAELEAPIGSPVSVDLAAARPPLTPPSRPTSERWTPPRRSALPTSDRRSGGRSDGPWRIVAGLLGVALVVALVLLLAGGRDGDGDPPSSTVVPSVSSVGEAGAGGNGG